MGSLEQDDGLAGRLAAYLDGVPFCWAHLLKTG
jgi:hypothetical protein